MRQAQTKLAYKPPLNPSTGNRTLPPQLSITAARPILMLSWPTNFSGSKVQSTTNLDSTDAWRSNPPESTQVRFAVYFLANIDNPSQIPAALFLGVDVCSLN
jgi:hypothetical protein